MAFREVERERKVGNKGGEAEIERKERSICFVELGFEEGGFINQKKGREQEGGHFFLK